MAFVEPSIWYEPAVVLIRNAVEAYDALAGGRDSDAMRCFRKDDWSGWARSTTSSGRLTWRRGIAAMRHWARSLTGSPSSWCHGPSGYVRWP